MIKGFLTAILICFCLYVPASAEDQNKIHIGKDDRCPVCAMKVARYPNFACTMDLKDGQKFSFCATGCLIRSWFYPEIFLKAQKADIRHVWVQDYFTGKKIDGLSAFWVAGSDVIGPMGPALVPLKSKSDIEVFKRRHGGDMVFDLSELTVEKWETITGKKIISR